MTNDSWLLVAEETRLALRIERSRLMAITFPVAEQSAFRERQPSTFDDLSPATWKHPFEKVRTPKSGDQGNRRRCPTPR